MNPYSFCLALGATGLTAMAATGLGQHAGHGHTGHGHAAQGHGHAGHGQAGHTAHGRAHDGGGLLRATAIASPRLWFTLLAGFGAAGLLVRPLAEGGPVRAALAVAGAVLFDAAGNIIGVIQTVLAAQLVGKSGLLDGATSPPAAPPKSVASEAGPTRR